MNHKDQKVPGERKLQNPLRYASRQTSQEIHDNTYSHVRKEQSLSWLPCIDEGVLPSLTCINPAPRLIRREHAA